MENTYFMDDRFDLQAQIENRKQNLSRKYVAKGCIVLPCKGVCLVSALVGTQEFSPCSIVGGGAAYSSFAPHSDCP